MSEVETTDPSTTLAESGRGCNHRVLSEARDGGRYLAGLPAIAGRRGAIEMEGTEVPDLDGEVRRTSWMRSNRPVSSVRQRNCPLIRILEDIALSKRVPRGRNSGPMADDADDGRSIWGRRRPAVGSSPGDTDEAVFRQELLRRARTFGFMRDARKAFGLPALPSALRSAIPWSLAMTILLINPGGLALQSVEFVRHKTLDAAGDLALAGAPFIGCSRPDLAAVIGRTRRRPRARLSDHTAVRAIVVDDGQARASPWGIPGRGKRPCLCALGDTVPVSNPGIASRTACCMIAGRRAVAGSGLRLRRAMKNQPEARPLRQS